MWSRQSVLAGEMGRVVRALLFLLLLSLVGVSLAVLSTSVS